MVPFFLSARCAGFATVWMRHVDISVGLNVLIKWGAENGSFYLSLYLCGLLLPKDCRKTEGDEEPLLQMVILEGFDTCLRLALFFASCSFPEYEEAITEWGSLGLDLVFLGLVAKSHRLMQISRRIFTLFDYNRPLALGLV